jgi:hypothetical protein
VIDTKYQILGVQDLFFKKQKYFLTKKKGFIDFLLFLQNREAETKIIQKNENSKINMMSSNDTEMNFKKELRNQRQRNFSEM